MKVYFAHPCFTPEQELFKKKFLEKLTPRLAGTGKSERSPLIELIDPFASVPNVEDDVEEKIRRSPEIKTACLQLLEACDVVIALIDWNDTGTAFEAGYAHSLSKPVLLISQKLCSAANAMLIGASRAMFDWILTQDSLNLLASMLEEGPCGTLPSRLASSP